MKPFSIKIIMFMTVKAMGRCITYFVVSTLLFYMLRVREFFGQHKQARVQASDRNWPHHAEIRERCFMIIALLYISFPKVVFIWHSGCSVSDLLRVCLENLSKFVLQEDRGGL